MTAGRLDKDAPVLFELDLWIDTKVKGGEVITMRRHGGRRTWVEYWFILTRQSV